MLATNKNSYYYILETLLPFGVLCELYKFKHYKIFSLKITIKNPKYSLEFRVSTRLLIINSINCNPL